MNYYPDNQWYLGGSTVPMGHYAYRPLRPCLRMSHGGDWSSIPPTWAGCGPRSTERGKPLLSGSATRLT
jgi:hypothetical protein